MGEGRIIVGANDERANDEQVLHGGALDRARATYPDVREAWIDLSTGINPVAYPVGEIDAGAWAQLPFEVNERALLQAAAAHYGVRGVADGDGVAHIAACPGTQAALQVLPRLFERCRVAVLGPTYYEHERCWRRAGFDVVVVADIDEALAARAKVVVVVNPNNPTGRAYDAERLLAAARDLDDFGGTLVIDEAFADLCDNGVSVAPNVSELSNVVVLRSFGKTYGLAGLRLGFVLGCALFIGRLRGELGPWAVSGPALEIGRVALRDDAWLEAQRLRLRDDSKRLGGLLSAAGLEIVGANPLFVLASTARADDVRDLLARRAIHVRHFPEHPTWLRFGMPGDECAWTRLSEALACTAESAASAP